MIFYSAGLLKLQIFLAWVYQCIDKAMQSVLTKFRHLFLISNTGCSKVFFFPFPEFLLVMSGYTFVLCERAGEIIK